MRRNLAVVIAMALTAPRVAAAQPPSAQAVRVGARDVAARIEALDPRVRERAFSEMRAAVNLRRAEWSRVTGAAGVRAAESALLSSLATTTSEPPALTHAPSASLFLDVRAPLYAGGAIDGAIDAARERAGAAGFDRAALRMQLEEEALTLLARIAGERAQLDVAARAVRRADAIIGLAKARLDSGLGSQVDVARSTMNRLRQAEDVEVHEGARRVAVAGLRAALMVGEVDIEPGDTLEALGALEARDARGSDARARAGSESPPVRAAAAQARAATADRDVAAAAALPRIEAFVSGSYGSGAGPATTAAASSALPPAPFPQLAGAATGGVMLTWNAWDFFATRDAVARADAEIGRAQAHLEDTRRDQRRAIDEARASEREAARRRDVLAGGRTIARETVELARARFESGHASMTDVLNAEVEAVAIESRSIQAAHDLAVAHVRRLRAEGVRP